MFRTHRLFIGGLRVARSFGSITYPAFATSLILAIDELILTPSVFIVSLYMSTWTVPLKSISRIENVEKGVRVYTDPNSEAFTFFTHHYVEIL